MLLDIGLSNILGDLSFLFARETKAKINKLDHIKLKPFANWRKHQQNKKAVNWIEEICKQCIQKGFNIQNTSRTHTIQYQRDKQINFKGVEDLNRHLSKEDIQIINRYMKRCWTSLIIAEMQIKTTMRNHLTPVRMAIIQKTTNNKCWHRDVEKGKS